MKKVLVVLAAAFATVAFYATPAFAAHPLEGHVFVDNPDVSCANPTLLVDLTAGLEGEDDTEVTIGPFGDDLIDAVYVKGGNDFTASVTFSADNTTATITSNKGISHYDVQLCEAPTTTTTTTTTDTGGPTTDTGGPTTDTGGPTTDTGGPTTDTGGPTTDTGGPTTDTGGPTTTTTGGATTGTGGVLGGTTGGTTGGTASTGGELPFTGLPVWIPLLAAAALLVSGIFLVRRKKGELA
jgi:hypothetical protein